MKQKPTCNLCFKKFTRSSNLLRHMKDIHNVLITGLNNYGHLGIKRGTKPVFAKNIEPSGDNEQPSSDDLEGSWMQLSKITKLAGDYTKSKNLFDTNENLKTNITNYQNQIADIYSYNWLTPINAIEGLSGYVCRRCNNISFTKTEYVGYDKTARARHSCNEEKVRSIKMVSINPFAVWDLYDNTATFMLKELDRIMPGQKYLLGEDMSSLFRFLESVLNPDVVKILLGIPDRYYFHTLSKEQMPSWINKVVGNVGNKTSAEDFEIRDFLRRVTSTYAIFEIPTDKSPTRILIKITS